MSNIIVAGAGHGGAVAAMKLAQQGHSVTVYEKSSYERLGLPHKDTFDESAMEFAGLEVPESWRAPNNIITIVPLDSEVAPLTLPEDKNARSLIVERKELIRHLISLAEEAGVSFVYGEEVLAPVMLGSRVGGIVTSGGVRYCDLVIDACGVHSPLRRAMPEFTRIQNEPGEFDVLHTYRAYYEKVEGEQDPATRYNIILKNDGTVGMSWLITEEDAVDVLIARFRDTDLSGFCEPLNELYEQYGHMGKKLLRGGLITDIPVRQPLAVFVADGYAAVGDSAFMTVPMIGSGIANSLKASRALTDAVTADSECAFSAETLWPYQVAYYKAVGSGLAPLACAKKLLLSLKPEEIDYLVESEIITSDDVNMGANFTSLGSLVSGMDVRGLGNKAKQVCRDKELVMKLLNCGTNMGKAAATCAVIPKKWNKERVFAWAKVYNYMFK